MSLLIFSAAALVVAALPAIAQQKTVKQCNTEWTANKASIHASGKTKKAFETFTGAVIDSNMTGFVGWLTLSTFASCPRTRTG